MGEEIDPSAVGDALEIGCLRRVIKTALPVSSTFKVSLQGELVPRRTIPSEDIEVTVDVIDEKFRKQLSDALREYWAQKVGGSAEDVEASKYALKVDLVPDPEDTRRKVKALVVPLLGPVIGNAISTKTSHTTQKLQERGYSDN